MRRALLLIFLGLISTNFASGIGYTVSCSSIPEAAGSCDQCFHFDLGTSNSPSDNFVPRTGIAAGSYEFIYTAQSSITGTTYQ